MVDVFFGVDAGLIAARLGLGVRVLTRFAVWVTGAEADISAAGISAGKGVSYVFSAWLGGESIATLEGEVLAD